jgi:cation:H+ antiporter
MLSGMFTAIEQGPIWLSWVLLVMAFAVLAKCADLFVDSAVGIASRLRLPKLVIGIVLVSVATTSPELSVSLMAALKGSPEMALGNAIGSIICNCGIALALCGVFSKTSVPVLKHAFRTAGGMLAFTCVLCALFVGFDLTLNRLEGGVLLLCFVGYLLLLIRQYKQGKMREAIEADVADCNHSALVLVILFAIGLAGVIVSSKFVVVTSVRIAVWMGVPEAVIALTLVALGTSIPEVATRCCCRHQGAGSLVRR